MGHFNLTAEKCCLKHQTMLMLGRRRGLEVDHRTAAREVRGSNPTLGGRRNHYFSALISRKDRGRSHARRQICWMDGRARSCARGRSHLMEMAKQVRSWD